MSALATSPLWFSTRATAVIAFVLLTLTFALGLAATKRALASKAWPRFATQQLHRNLSLLALGFMLAHIVTTIADGYVTISWWSFVIPGASAYRTLPVALGTLAFDTVLALIVTSLLRDKLPVRAWRAIHWCAYAVWPMAFVHFLTAGTDAADGRWGFTLALVSATLLGAAAALRLLTGNPQRSGPTKSAPHPVAVQVVDTAGGRGR